MQAPGCTCHPARSTPDESGVGLPAGAWKSSHNLCRPLARPWVPADPTLDLSHRTRDSNVTAGTSRAAEDCPGSSSPVRAGVATSTCRELTTGASATPALHPELRRPISPTPSILSVGYDDVPLGFPRGPPPCQRRSLRPPSFRGGECTTVSASSRSILDVAAEDRFPPIRPPQRHRSRNLTRVASDTARTRRHREQDETDNVFPTPKGRTHRRYRVRHSGTSVRPVDSRCHARVATNATRPAYSPQDADKAQRHAPKV
jgi:hypothetical protein